MDMISLDNVSFAYSGSRDQAGVKDVTLTIAPGEVVAICGKSGCGKTTVCRLINGLIPHYFEGRLSGSVSVDGKDVGEAELYDLMGKVGSVFQNPRSQFFAVDTTSELAFGCENIGMEEREIIERIDDVVKDFSLEDYMDRSIFELSSGEKQRIACGSVATLHPDIIVLDEPTSNLDYASMRELRDVLVRWKEEGKTIIIAEHRLHLLRGLVDRVILMDEGEIKAAYEGEAFFHEPDSFFQSEGLRTQSIDTLRTRTTYQHMESLNRAIALEGFRHSYGEGRIALDIPTATIPGNVVAVIGPNGAGKTTFAKSLCGLLKNDKGKLYLDGRAFKVKDRLKMSYMVMQDADHQLFTESVLEEVLLSMSDPDEEKARETLKKLSLEKIADRHPLSLSGGQKQRVTVATALASGASLVVFDEPTSGLDRASMQEVAKLVKTLEGKGAKVFVVTHDPEFIVACCDYAIVVEGGMLIEQYTLDEDGAGRMVDYFERQLS